MSEKKQESFTVTDRRLFTSDGELRREVSEEEVVDFQTGAGGAPAAAQPAAKTVSGRSAPCDLDPSVPPTPTADEQKEQADAYRKSAKELDARVELSGHSAKEMEMTFERFMASLYMTAMLQLGLMQEERGQPRIDLMAHVRPWTRSACLAEKTKGNLTRRGRKFPAELPLRTAHGLRGSHQCPGPAAASDRHQSLQTMKATLTVLGSGTSMGVPTIGCDCAVCRSSDPHDRRTRPSVLIEYGGRYCAHRHHARLSGAGDPRKYPQPRRSALHARSRRPYSGHRRSAAVELSPQAGRLPLYAHPEVVAFLRNMFRYIFDADYKFGGCRRLNSSRWTGLWICSARSFEPVTVIHGETEIYGYRFGSAAYLTDHSLVPEASFEQLQDLDILFLDALRHKPHPTHSTVENSLRIVERVKPRRAFFTHICHDLPHEETNASLPENVRLSYDGMKLEFEI